MQIPDASDFKSKVPVRIRAEKVNSLNNRFREDGLIKTKAVLSLDDDIFVPCGDIGAERHCLIINLTLVIVF